MKQNARIASFLLKLFIIVLIELILLIPLYMSAPNYDGDDIYEVSEKCVGIEYWETYSGRRGGYSSHRNVIVITDSGERYYFPKKIWKYADIEQHTDAESLVNKEFSFYASKKSILTDITRQGEPQIVALKSFPEESLQATNDYNFNVRLAFTLLFVPLGLVAVTIVTLITWGDLWFNRKRRLKKQKLNKKRIEI